jgi:RNA polymerase sigma-70 factor (ECF subfamily)
MKRAAASWLEVCSRALGFTSWGRPREWPNPGDSLDKEEFWQTYRDCSGKLPKNVAAVFNLREVDDLNSKTICRMLDISERNLWVMLHRARMALRRCLEINWFGKAGEAL